MHSSSSSLSTAIRDWRLASTGTRLRPEVIYRVSAADANGIADAFVRDWTKYFVGSADRSVDYVLVEEGGENEKKHKEFVRKVRRRRKGGLFEFFLYSLGRVR